MSGLVPDMMGRSEYCFTPEVKPNEIIRLIYLLSNKILLFLLVALTFVAAVMTSHHPIVLRSDRGI